MYKLNQWNNNTKFYNSKNAKNYFMNMKTQAVSTACGSEITVSACGSEINTACGSEIVASACGSEVNTACGSEIVATACGSNIKLN